jgi:hypothetical protein
MARLASKEKLGYYPTPPEVTKLINAWIKRGGTGKIRVFDPCCGEGTAVAAIATHLQAESYGVELDTIRSGKAKDLVTTVIHGDSLRASIKPESVSCLFLNPPYDDDDGGRLENKFLTTHTGSLMVGGIIVLIISVTSYSEWMGKFLSAWFTDLRVYRFPGKLFDSFRQMVVFGKRKATPVADDRVKEGLVGSIKRQWAEGLEEPSKWFSPYKVPVSDVPDKLFYFRSLNMTAEDMVKEVEKDGFQDTVIEMLVKLNGNGFLRPAAPLRKGHLAILVAAGLTDGLVEKNGKRYLIKGIVRKEKVKTKEFEEDATIIKEVDVLKIEINGLDLNTGQLFSIQ